MWRKRVVFSLLFALIAAQTPARSRQKSQETGGTPLGQPRIEISSVTVAPSEMHARQKPNEAIVTVQLFILNVPPGSVATLGVGTYSGSPSKNNVRYSETQTLPLKTSPTAFNFKVRPSEKTVNGRVTIAAEIVSATRGINVISPADTDPSVWRCELKTIVP